jgi:hypothetical protein
MEASTSQIIFKTSDKKLVKAADNFEKLSLMLCDMISIQLLKNDPIELENIHSRILEKINECVDRLFADEALSKQVPYNEYEEAKWNEFTVSLLFRKIS